MNILQMLKYTPARIKKGTVKTVKSNRLIRSIYDVDEHGPHQKAMFKVLATTIPRRVTFKIYGDPQGPKTVYQRPTWVHCSCEWFCFFCEYSLAKRRSSDIISCNGQAPKEKNPRMWPYICKHIVAVQERLKNLKWKQPRVKKPSDEEIEFILREVNKYIPGL